MIFHRVQASIPWLIIYFCRILPWEIWFNLPEVTLAFFVMVHIVFWHYPSQWKGEFHPLQSTIISLHGHLISSAMGRFASSPAKHCCKNLNWWSFILFLVVLSHNLFHKYRVIFKSSTIIAWFFSWILQHWLSLIFDVIVSKLHKTYKACLGISNYKCLMNDWNLDSNITVSIWYHCIDSFQCNISHNGIISSNSNRSHDLQSTTQIQANTSICMNVKLTSNFIDNVLHRCTTIGESGNFWYGLASFSLLCLFFLLPTSSSNLFWWLKRSNCLCNKSCYTLLVHILL